MPLLLLLAFGSESVQKLLSLLGINGKKGDLIHEAAAWRVPMDGRHVAVRNGTAVRHVMFAFMKNLTKCVASQKKQEFSFNSNK